MGENGKELSGRGLSRRQFLSLSTASAGLLSMAGVLGEGALASAAKVNATLHVGWNSPPDVMNPFTFTTTASNEILWLIYDTLMEYDINLKPVPGLAESETVSNGGRTFTYVLRPGATWHDGKPVTSADVKFTYEVTAKNNLGQAAWAVADLASVEAPNSRTVVINYNKPQAFDPSTLVAIVPQHILGHMTPKKIESFANPSPVGSGPFTFKEWITGQSVQVDRYEKWWGPLPAAASVIWVQFENSDVMVQSLVSGDIDIITEVPAVLWDGLKGKANVAPVSMESFSFHHIGFNVSTNPKSGGNPLILDKTVREALSYSLNRQQLVDLCLAGHGLPASVQLPKSFGQWQDVIPLDQQYDNNPTKGNSLLEAAGYKMGPNGVRVDKRGKPLSFRLIAIQTTDEDVLAGQIFVKSAQKVGIELTLDTLDATTLGNIVYNAAAPNWDIFIWGWDSASPDPDYLLSVPLTSQIGSNNDVYYSNPEYNRLYAQQATTVDHGQRVALVHEIQKLFYDDAAYCIMWYQSKLQAYRTNTWKGWRETKGGIVYNFTRSNYLTVTPK